MNQYDAIIIGAGFAGIGAGIKLKMNDINSFVIFERASDIGGTWRDNTYPGCACDIPSLLYCYSFEPKPDWSRAFSPQKEIWQYLHHCVDKYGLNDHIRLNTGIESIRFDKQTGRWIIRTKDGDDMHSRVVISAAGPFNAPFIPNIPGQELFEGPAFHSMEWDHDIDLTDKKVGVIGTGASAIQFIPEIAPKVKKLVIFQRTPPWIIPKNDKRYPTKTHDRFRKHPWFQQFWRSFIYWYLEYRGKALFGNNKMNEKRKKEALEHLHNQVKDPELLKKLTPDYTIGCKRILISDNYYPTLCRENVELITEPAAEITRHSIKTNRSEERKVDVIIYGTGFYTTTFPQVYRAYGLEEQELFERWNSEGGEAYYGVCVHGYPNLLYMVGPNTGLGHNSIIHMMESQLNFIVDFIKILQKAPHPGAYLHVKKEAQKAFNEKIQNQLKDMVWSDGGCKSYYLRDGDGKNTSIWPGSTVTYRRQTRKVKRDDFDLITPEKVPVEEEVTIG